MMNTMTMIKNGEQDEFGLNSNISQDFSLELDWQMDGRTVPLKEVRWCTKEKMPKSFFRQLEPVSSEHIKCFTLGYSLAVISVGEV